MATIAELQIKVDSTETERGTKALLALAEAADKAAAARKRLNDIRGGGGGGGGPPGGGGDDSETRRTRSLSEAIDAQTRKLADLARQRKALSENPIRTENPEEYARLNREIDARTELVRRQGNSLDTLTRQEKRAQEQRQRAADAIKASNEREARQAQQKEEREARQAALAEARLTATLSSLSRQVKAQEDYNRTVAQLNAARAPTTGTASLGQAQYETYVKQAAAIRDAALAQADNSKEIERAQRLYDASVASLGKVERAQALYARNLRDSDKALALNLITQEQYNAKIAAFATKRDASIAAANNNANAEARMASQLQSVLSAYDPVLRATDNYNNSIRVLAKGFESGKVSIEQFNKALGEQRAALDSVKAAQPNSQESQAKSYQNALDRLLPFNAQLRNLAESERVLKKAKDDGKVTTDQQIKDYDRATKAIAAERAEIERRSQAERRGNSAKQDAAALRGLPAQFTDVVVSLQGGQAPLTVLLQQGGQVKDMFGGVGNALKAVGGALLKLINPVTVVGAALGVAAFGAYKANSEINNLKLTLATSGTVTGLTTTQVYDMAKSLDDVAYSTGQAVSVITKLAETGTVTGDNFEQMAKAIISFSHATGQSTDVLTEQLAAIGKDPVSAVKSLVDKYGILNSSMLLNASQAVAYGEKRQAVTEIEKQAAIEMQLSADKIEKNLSDLQRFARATTKVFDKLGDSIVKVWRGSGDKELDAQEEVVKALENKITLGGAYGKAMKAQYQDEYDAQVKVLDNMKATRAEESRLAAERKKANQDAVDAQIRIISRHDASLDSVTRATNEIKKQEADWKLVEAAAAKAGRTITQQEKDFNDQTTKGLQKKLKDAKEQADKAKNPTTPIDSREVQEVKSNLNVITSQYDAAYKKITALGAANVVSQEATFASQKALLEQQKNAVTGSYDEQIAAIKKLQGVKGNNASQNISLDNQLTRAEDARLKAMQDLNSKTEVLTVAYEDMLKRRKESIKAYSDALQQQIENTKQSGEADVAAVGTGDRQNKLNQDLLTASRQFAKEQLSLSKQLSNGMNFGEYSSKLKLATEAHDEMTAQILKNDADIQAANVDWTNGFTKAVQNLADEANNVAGAVNSAFSGAFASMGDELGTFVTTGKLDFKSLASSILSDMAKIAARAATNAALSSLFSFAGAAFGAGSAGGGTTSGITGFSEQIGGNVNYKAKGGAYSGGTEFFAQGGAFTNSIVSSPTAFGMSGGGRGVMGEAGPEAIVPLARASDGSLGVRLVGGAGNQSSGGVNVYVTINSDGSASSETDKAGTEQFGREIGTIIESKYRQLLARDLRDGGDIKNAIKAG